MRLRKQKFTMLFALMFAATLALPAFYSFAPRTVKAKAIGQDQSRSDAKAPAKTKSTKPRVPTGTPPPANDNCSGAIAINACPFTDSKDTSGATDETGEPQSTCTLQANSVWYTLPASVNTRIVSAATCNSDFDTAIMVWQVDTANPCNFASFVAAACNDDFCGDGLQSTASFTALPNTTYKIQVGGFDGETGNLVVDVTCTELQCPPIVINGTLGSGDPEFTGPQSTGTTVGRLNRNGISSTCAAPKTCLIFDTVTGRQFDSYSIPNDSGNDVCVNVNLSADAKTTCNVQTNAYLGTFDPNNICTNYLADPGLSTGVPPTPTNMSFTVPAGQTLTIVVMTTNPGEIGCPYQVTVLGDLCAGFDYCVQDDHIPGRFIKISSTTGKYEYHDCSKGITISGTGTVAISFCKIQLTSKGPDPKKPDRAISVLVNPCTMRGDASVKGPGVTGTVALGDADVTNNNCACPQ